MGLESATWSVSCVVKFGEKLFSKNGGKLKFVRASEQAMPSWWFGASHFPCRPFHQDSVVIWDHLGSPSLAACCCQWVWGASGLRRAWWCGSPSPEGWCVLWGSGAYFRETTSLPPVTSAPPSASLCSFKQGAWESFLLKLLMFSI